MKTIRVYQLNHLAPMLFHRLKEAQMEAAQVWNCCMEMHKQARLKHTRWPGRNEMQQATKGHFALHSQSVQMVVHAFLANITTTRELRKTLPQMRMKYPWRTKHFYPVHWPAQAVSKEKDGFCCRWAKVANLLCFPLICLPTVGHVHWSGIVALNCMSA